LQKDNLLINNFLKKHYNIIVLLCFLIFFSTLKVDNDVHN